MTLVRIHKAGVTAAGHSGATDVCNAVGASVQIAAAVLSKLGSLKIATLDKANGVYSFGFTLDVASALVRDALAEQLLQLAAEQPHYLTVDDLRGV